MAKKTKSSSGRSAKSLAWSQPQMARQKPTMTAHTMGVLGIVSGVISFFLIPPLFLALGVILGALALHNHQRKLGWIAIILSLALGILGFLLAGYLGSLA